MALAAALLAGVLGLAAGGLGGFLVGNGASAAGTDDRRERNITAGCTILEAANADFPIRDDALRIDNPFIWELTAAGASFQAAGAASGDPETDPLYSTGNRLVSSLQRLDTDMANQSVEELRAYCE